jgi:hypothetical protein
MKTRVGKVHKVVLLSGRIARNQEQSLDAIGVFGAGESA